MSGGKREKKEEIYLGWEARKDLSQKMTLNKNLEDTKEYQCWVLGVLEKVEERVETKVPKKREAGRPGRRLKAYIVQRKPGEL